VTPEKEPGRSSVSAGSLKLAAFLQEGVRGTDSSREKWMEAGAKAVSLLETASPAVGVFLETEVESPALAQASLLEETEWAMPDASWVGRDRKATRQKSLLHSPA
jgi:hypothetical protein